MYVHIQNPQEDQQAILEPGTKLLSKYSWCFFPNQMLGNAWHLKGKQKEGAVHYYQAGAISLC